MKQVQVVTVGEGLVVLRAPHSGLLERSHQFEVLASGAEVNVAVGLARLGITSAWMSKLPQNPLARNIVSQIQGVGVDTSYINWVDEGRVGIIFQESGSAPRPNTVIYDRAYSTAAELLLEDLDWDVIAASRLLHTTGITAGISLQARNTTLAMCQEAQQLGLKVSFDVNYRSKIWDVTEASKFIRTIAPHLDILILSREDAYNLMGLGELSPQETAQQIAQQYKLSVVVVTLGESGSIAWDGDSFYNGTVYDVKRLNRYGAGDSFVAGFLYGFLQGDLQLGMDYGSALAAYKMTLPNDNFPIFQRNDIERVIREGGRVTSSAQQAGTAYSVDR